MDKKNGNHLWAGCINLEIDHPHQCDTYEDVDKGQSTKYHKKIRDHFAFDVKHDSGCISMLVDDGHLTYVPLSSVYSVVASLRGVSLVLFLAKLNGLES